MNPFFEYQSNRDIPRSIERYGIGNLVDSADKPRLLDIGCNEGQYCFALADRCSQCVGFEPATEIIAPALAVAPANVRFVNRGFKCAMLRGERFDVILVLAVLSHLEASTLLARSLASALHPGGALVFLSHTIGCDPQTERRTDRFLLELRRFLDVERSEIVDCCDLEAGDKQGVEGLQRRLVVFRNKRQLRIDGQRFEFHAAGGTSLVFRYGDIVAKWFEVEHDRISIDDQIPHLADAEAAYLREAESLGVYPKLRQQGQRHLVMEYRGEQPSRHSWPVDWEQQVEKIQEKLVEFGRPLPDLALENVLVDPGGRLSLIDPVPVNGQHQEPWLAPDRFAERMHELVERDLMTKPDLSGTTP